MIALPAGGTASRTISKGGALRLACDAGRTAAEAAGLNASLDDDRRWVVAVELDGAIVALPLAAACAIGTRLRHVSRCTLLTAMLPSLPV